ncbi:MAG: undecaprenyldiphospho-muramoylpentapeptide beta-N-acetylglucosaminyltransferase [Ruminococcaceae bacterium]|nr:undecaprenyldiphospho-muramoylpentapeptide beta-N-acetylglucosaminyltransferase [Oscillospiraceae bacterium]
MRVLLSGGGTGGHINPALAIAKRILKSVPDAEVAFVGTPYGMENKLIPREGFKLYHVDVKGFIRKPTLKNVPILYKAVTSPFRAKKILKEFKPDIVIGTGGYASWPIVKAASKAGIPTAIHEQNAVPGVTTKMLSRYVDKVMISFKESAEYIGLPEKTVLVGNPVSPEILNADRKEAREKFGLSDKLCVLSFGGSLGAREINNNVLDFIEKYVSGNTDVVHVHAIGSYEWEKRKERVESLKGIKNAEILEYIYDMPMRMAASDVVICRAGAITLAELAVMGKPAILIPSPNVTNNHQYKNALVLKNSGAAEIIEEKYLTPDALIKAVDAIVKSPDRLEEMHRNMLSLAIRDSGERIYEIIKNLTDKK